MVIVFLIMLIMPIILFSLCSVMIVSLQMNSLNESYDMKAKTTTVISNPIQIMNRLTRGVFNDIKYDARINPEKLENISYIEELDAKLEDKFSFLLVRKENELIYEGEPLLSHLIKYKLPEFGINHMDVDGGIYIGGDNPFLVKAQDFYFQDGSQGTIFIITDIDTMVPQVKYVAWQGIISLLVIITISCCTLFFWFYQSFVKKLNMLRIASHQMREGDLNIPMQIYTRDEIGQLSSNLEEMRLKLKELTREKLQYEENMKEMLSNISHDLKTPLTTIKGYAEGLIDGVADTPQKEEKYLKTIFTKANDMSILVDELSYYAKIDANTMPFQFTEVNVNDYFSDCVEELRFDLEVKGIQLDYESYADDHIQVIADLEQLRRVINNIVSNSVKHVDKEKKLIRVCLYELEDEIRIDIIDNGMGIPKKDLPYIFDRFYRADTSRNTRKGGSGLGLAISKKIIEEHEGRIWAVSEEGEGTTIIFTLKKVQGKQALKQDYKVEKNRSKKDKTTDVRMKES